MAGNLLSNRESVSFDLMDQAQVCRMRRHGEDAMRKLIFVNLPVADLGRSIDFHERMGAVNDPMFTNETAAKMTYSDEIHVMLLTHERFADFTDKERVDAHRQAQALFCLSAESREEIDRLVELAGASGGRSDPGPVQEHGFMYGRSYEDPDGHIFELAWMDMAALEKAMAAAD